MARKRGRGRPKLARSDRRCHRVNFRLTESEWNDVARLSAKTTCTPSDLIRAAIHERIAAAGA